VVTLLILEPTAKMAYDVIKNPKNRRDAGEDGISAELITSGGQRLWKEIYELIQIIWNTETFLKVGEQPLSVLYTRMAAS
jgi:hypothetical protein